ncbi:hypothetical protein [Synechococcus sp. ROS8604]|uniref:hypothetical protein n=1 Tax=Synechococcus sp. ROS8604 TaxID=1442557 RepID=UPI001CA3B21F|nr:hypothetical protein [Synechococcus sp. ROS8604]
MTLETERPSTRFRSSLYFGRAVVVPLIQGRLHPSHHFQSDEQQKHVIPCSCTSRLGGSPRSGLPQLERHADLSSHNRRLGLFERLSGRDQRDQLLFKDIVRSNVLTASSGLLLGAPTDEELTLGDAWLEVFQQALPRASFAQPASSLPGLTARSSKKNPLATNSLLTGPRARSRAIAAPG